MNSPGPTAGAGKCGSFGEAFLVSLPRALLCIWVWIGVYPDSPADRADSARGIATIEFAPESMARHIEGAEVPGQTATALGGGALHVGPDEIALTVLVTDEAGRRIPNAMAALLYEDERLPLVRALADEARVASSDANGELVLACPRNVDARRRPALTVRARGFGSASILWDRLKFTEPTVVVLKRGLSIRGRVAHPSDPSRPLEGINLVCRGRGANTDASDPRVFPAAEIRVHRARSDSRGEFAFSGLSEGRYKVEIASPGLVAWSGASPLGNKPRVAARNPAIVAAGTTDLTIKAVPLGVYAVEIRDGKTAGPIQGTHVRPRFIANPVIPLPSQGRFFSHIFVVGGKAFDLGTLESGRFAVPVVLPEYPLERRLPIELHVSAPGYRAKTIRVDCQSMLPGIWDRAARIELEPTGEWARVDCRMVGRNGVSVGRLDVPLLLRNSGTGDRIELLARLDAEGWARGIAVPAGQWEALLNWPTLRTESAGTAFSTTPGQTVDVSIVMDSLAAFHVEIRAPSGEPLDDVGLRLGRGEGVVRKEVVRTDHQVRIYGDWLIPPGRGHFRNRWWPISEPGVWTIEAHHHAYVTVRKTIVLSHGDAKCVTLRYPTK